MILSSNAIWTVISIGVGVIVYAVVLIFTKTITEDELYSIPKGTKIIGLLKKIHLL